MKILREINIRYVFAVTLIAALAIITFILNQNLHQRMNEDFKIINISGRQRMLSQKIALLADKNQKAELHKSVREFKEGLNVLINSRFVKADYPHVQELYYGANGIKVLTDQYLALYDKVNPDVEQILLLSQKLLSKFDEVTFLKQTISETEYRNRFLLEMIILAITLILLTFEVIYIFRPMEKRVGESFEQLNRIEDKSLVSSRLAMIGEIASSIGHEIKNPLSVLMVLSEKGFRETKEEQSNLFFTQIHKSTERINKIIKSLAVQAREATNDPMIETPIQNVIDDALELFSAKIKLEEIKLTKDLNYSGLVHCRHAAISQVIANLIANAIDAVAINPNDEREIRIESGKLDNEIFVRVIDSGSGVPEDIQDKIFESFITTKEAGKGTGLGLSISRKIMKEHNGHLMLNPEISRSCFEIRFQAAV